MRDKVIPSVAAVALGLWVLATPVIFVFFKAVPVAALNHLIVGIAVVALAMSRAVGRMGVGASWAVAALGLWLVASPWLLGYSNAEAYANPGLLVANDVVVGGLLAALGAWAALLTRDVRQGHGHVFAAAMPDEHERPHQ
ncbi:SPW repeat protein [compost metagenome]